MDFISVSLKTNNIFTYRFLQKLVFRLAFFSVTFLFAQENSPLEKKETTYKGVYDYANMLSPEELSLLSQKLINYSDTTSTQIAIAIIESLNGNDISMLAAEKAHDWGIGQKGKDNGIFIVISQKDRKINISTGYGVEHLLTDYKSKEIIDNVITPNFKNQQYYKGLDQATNIIFEILAGTYKADTKEETSGGISFLFIIFVIIIIFIFLNNKNNSGKGNGKNNKSNRNSSDILTAILLSNLGRSSRSSGGFGGSFGSGGGFGGGGSFGSGGFGGGGASGGW